MPSGLAPRGRQLWAAGLQDGKLAPLEQAVLLEACRLADRLDKLDAQLHGDGPWLELDPLEDGRTFVVVVTGVLKEARQQAVAFKQLVSELRQGGASRGRGRPGRTGSATSGATPATGGVKGAGIADITARIAERRAEATP
ncbi:hypothetical protein [Amycolatopsis methanolica]|uniref:hypothetical protein n=1 Tax=Amycolatopsis methanolica TaxID=1814 RepID=UPI00036E3374|nr:hypothetical protein [Amycolatopsis methanolica]